MDRWVPVRSSYFNVFKALYLKSARFWQKIMYIKYFTILYVIKLIK